MIKHINHQNFLTTAFVATKKWELQNVDNDDVVLLEPVDSDEVAVALEYLDYTGTGDPVINTDCSIAFEQQDADKAIYQEGATGSGIFYPDSEPQNNDGTFKRLVHDQTKGAFYNKRGNPTQMFGMDYVDFPLSRTERYLSDAFRMFTIPRNYFGERIVGNSVYLYDEALDDNVEIRDDGYQNLVAGRNLFSKVQEVRGYNLPESFLNIIISGSVDNGCPVFKTYVHASGSDSVGVSTTLLFGSVVNHISGDSDGVTVGFVTGSADTSVVVVTGSNPAPTMAVSFNSGFLTDLITTISGSDGGFTGSLGADIVTVTLAPTGSVLNTIAVPTSGSETTFGIVSMSFQSGSIFVGAKVTSGSEANNGNVVTIGFFGGSLNG